MDQAVPRTLRRAVTGKFRVIGLEWDLYLADPLHEPRFQCFGMLGVQISHAKGQFGLDGSADHAAGNLEAVPPRPTVGNGILAPAKCLTCQRCQRRNARHVPLPRKETTSACRKSHADDGEGRLRIAHQVEKASLLHAEHFRLGLEPVRGCRDTAVDSKLGAERYILA